MSHTRRIVATCPICAAPKSGVMRARHLARLRVQIPGPCLRSVQSIRLSAPCAPARGRKTHTLPSPGADLPMGARAGAVATAGNRSEEHTSELQSRGHLVCRLLLDKKKTNTL